MSTTVTVVLIGETCILCGVVFGLNDAHQRALKETGDTFYCSNGHGMVYGNPLKKRIEKLEAQLKQEEEEREYWRRSCQAEEKDHKATKNQLRGTKATLTKTKKRVGNGVCPCCNRTFKQLARHMENKHPDYQESEG